MALTITEGHETEGWATKDTRIGIWKLRVEDALQLYISGRLLAVRCGGNDAVHVLGVAWVLAVSNGVGNQRVRVRDVRRLGEINHGVRVVLLVAWVCLRLERINTIDSSEGDTWLVREDISAANKLSRTVSGLL